MKGKKIVFDDIKPSRVRKGDNPKVRRTKVHESRRPQHVPEIEDGLQDWRYEEPDCVCPHGNNVDTCSACDEEATWEDDWSGPYSGDEDWY